MIEPFQYSIYENLRFAHSCELEGPVELGRQQPNEEAPYHAKRQGPVWRLIIARTNEHNLSRQHVRIEPINERRARVCNLSTKVSVVLSDEREVGPQNNLEVDLPLEFYVGDRMLKVTAAQPAPPAHDFKALGAQTMAPSKGLLPIAAGKMPVSLAALPGTDMMSILDWLQTAMEVLQSAAGSSDFFQRAARAVVENVGLDTGATLLLENNEWKVQALHRGMSSAETMLTDEWRPSRNVLAQMSREKRTLFQTPEEAAGALSLVGVQAIVAAPILNSDGTVIGALYGDRHNMRSGLPQISRLDAKLVELLACGVATGLARLDQEKAALAARIHFESFFTPELSRVLEAQPDLLKGRDEEVTILFCDIRGFSRISERLGPAGTVTWIGDILEVLSECVQDQRGVLVDYIGDALMAMWGAPGKQPDHASLACQAALAMHRRLPEVNHRWQAIVGEPAGLGVGINTGQARVGNTGSTRKFKYGPLGNTVNLASRVEGATKYLKSKILITGHTQCMLGEGFCTRKLCTVRVVNIALPVDLYEVLSPDQQQSFDLKQRYEDALADFERGNFRAAARILGNLLPDYPNDGPSLVLMSRTVHNMIEEPPAFDPVWELPGK